MIVRTFQGPSMREALDKVREVFGPEAVILETKINRTSSGGSRYAPAVTVTAAGETPGGPTASDQIVEGPKSLHIDGVLTPPAGIAAEAVAPPDLQADSPTEVGLRPDAISRLTTMIGDLRRGGQNDEIWTVFRRWLATQPELAGGLIDAFVTHLSESLPPFDPFLETTRRPQTILVVGGRGVGRSTVLFKALATRWRTRDRKPGLALISERADHGQERLAAWCERCSVTLHSGGLDDASRLTSTPRHDGDDLLIEYVPAAGAGALEKAARQIRRAFRPDAVALVLSATGAAVSWRRDCERFRPFRPTHLFVTHWDEMQPWWEVLAVARFAGVLPAYRIGGTEPLGEIEPFSGTDLRSGLLSHLSLQFASDPNGEATGKAAS